MRGWSAGGKLQHSEANDLLGFHSEYGEIEPAERSSRKLLSCHGMFDLRVATTEGTLGCRSYERVLEVVTNHRSHGHIGIRYGNWAF